MIHPADIEEVIAYGTGNMGDVTDRKSTARFSLSDAKRGFALKSFWIRAISGADGDAVLDLWIDHRRGPAYDWIPMTWAKFGRGSGADVESEIFTRMDEIDLADFACWRDPQTGAYDEFCLSWTNPGTIIWSAGFRLIDIDKVSR